MLLSMFADVVFLGVFVSTATCHHLFSVVAGNYMMAIASSSLSGSTVACYEPMLSSSSSEQCRGLLLLPAFFLLG